MNDFSHPLVRFWKAPLYYVVQGYLVETFKSSFLMRVALFTGGLKNYVRLRCLFIWFGVVSLLPGTLWAQSTQVQVCAVDASTEAGLADASVTLSWDVISLLGTTGPNGCYLFSGQIPVSTEDERPVNTTTLTSDVYPNPAYRSAKVIVSGTLESFQDVQLFDIQGRRVQVSYRSERVDGGFVLNLELDHLSQGVYVYRVLHERGISTGKLVRLDQPGAIPIAAGSAGRQMTGSETQGTMDETLVRIEVSKDGYASFVDERVVRNNTTEIISILKGTDAKVPLLDMNGVAYLGTYEGGLYPEGKNEIPDAHYQAGVEIARQIEPLNLQGQPDPNGKIIMTSVGMSNTSSMFCGVADPNDPCKQGTFMSRFLDNQSTYNANLVLIDGADPGKTAEKWEIADDATYRRVLDEELEPFGHSELQVQVAWINLTNARPSVSLPDPAADAVYLKEQYGNILRALKERYPNLKMVFFSSRLFAGYATTDLNPEPYAYETGFAVKWVLEAQINQMHQEHAPIDNVAGDLNYSTVAPWAAWGPYLWANGEEPRQDGVFWVPDDFKDDGTHPARFGIEKVGDLLFDYFQNSGLTRCWFMANGTCE